jgi:hypothetical protein
MKKSNEARNILIWHILNAYGIYEMSMKKKLFTSDFHTYLGYSILILDILFMYGQ